MTLDDTIYQDTFDTRKELLEAVNKYLVQRNYGGAVICKSGESKGTEYCYSVFPNDWRYVLLLIGGMLRIHLAQG